ncbi:MAG: hypothetical protein ABEI97_02780 [Candidatus Nanohaloarchaea archaeon]
MDLRVLAAVFLTLFAVAIGMAQGNIDVADVRDGLQGLRTGVDLTDALTQQTGNTSSGTSISGTITAPGSVDLSIGAPTRLTFTVGGDAAVSVGGSTVEPAANTSITVNGFEGDIHISPDNVSITGAVTRFATDRIAFDYEEGAEFTAALTTPHLSVDGLQRQTLQFSNATGTVTADATEIQVSGDQAVLEGFTGNLSVDGTAYTLDGTVTSAALGDAQVN